jgi:hypothetical protein
MVSNLEKPKLYVGCSLTLAPPEFVRDVEETKERLNDKWEVMEFLGLGAAEPGDVYRKDIIDNVGGCDAFLGIADEPAWGLGFETREAMILKKPTLLVAQNNRRITRLALDAPLFNPTMRFRRYENMKEDVPRIVLEEFEIVEDAVLLRNRI